MPRENARQRSDRLLLEGRLCITTATTTTVDATVRGEGHQYRAGYRDGTWWCTCPARTTCSHLFAIKRVVAVDIEDQR